MPDTKISGLPAAGAPAGSDLLPIVSSGETKRASFTDIVATLGGSPSFAEVDIASDVVLSAGDNIVSWASAPNDDEGYWLAGSPTRLTVPSGLGGWYIAEFVSCAYQTGPPGAVHMASKLLVNGVAVSRRSINNNDLRDRVTAHAALLQLVAGDYLEVAFYINALAATLYENMSTANSGNKFLGTVETRLRLAKIVA